MKAIRIEGPGRVRVVEEPLPRAEPGEVLVRVLAAGLCATDRRLAIRGTAAPRIPGHEIAGVLEDGTAVGVNPNLGCDRCEWCAAGTKNACPGHVDIGIHRDGGLAEWVAVPAGHVVPLHGLQAEVATAVEPAACCLHAARRMEVREGERAVVVGAGTLGVVGMWVLQALGARVAVVQRSAPRRLLAAALGADAVLGPDDDPAGLLGGPPHVALVTAPGADALRWALENVGVGGRVHAFAGTPGGAPVDANVVHYRHLALVGSTGSTVEDYRRTLDLVRSGSVPLARLPFEAVALDEVPGILLDAVPDPRRLRFVARLERTVPLAHGDDA